MDIESFRDYCLKKKGVTESFPFDEGTLVFKVAGKMFALCNLDRLPLQINLKCDPERAENLRVSHDGHIIPGYHMNKKHWNSLMLRELPETLVRELIDHSYTLVTAQLSKKQQQALTTS